MFQLTKLLLFIGYIVIQISSIDVRYREPYEITCDFDELKDPVSWIYNDSVVFSCEAPYRSGGCKIIDACYLYNIDYEGRIMSVRISESEIREWKRGCVTWSCSHGDQKQTYAFDETESPQICSCKFPEDVLKIESTATITLATNSTKPYKVTWSSIRRGVIKTEEFKDTYRINNASLSIQTTCLDNVDTFTFVADNGASFPVVEVFHLKVECETIVLEDEMNKTIEVEIGQNAIFDVLYAGVTKPSNIMWYREMTTDLKFLTDYRIERTVCHETHSMGLIIHSVQKQDVGTYTAEIQTESQKTFTKFELLIKSKVQDPPFSWYVGIAIGAGSGMLICIVIFIAIIMLREMKSKNDNYLTPNPLAVTPPPPTPHDSAVMGSSVQSYNDSDFDEGSETYENMG